MSYQVLARKLRPTAFAELVGQDHVVRALTHALDNDRLHHAFLFTGTRGVGKTTIARILARSLNCEEGVSSTPCGVCSCCRELLEGRFVDLLEVDAASRTGVADTRELLDNAQYLPTRGRYKVYLIDEVHMLSTAAFNALLKTLEEPPEHVIFVLATTDPKKVPVTVLSRCLQFQLKNLSATVIADYLAKVLEQEGVKAEREALEPLAQAARGSMRDALSLTDQAIAHGGGALAAEAVAAMLGSAGRDEVDALLAALAAQDSERALALTRELAERGVDFKGLLEALLGAWHRLAVEHATAVGSPAFDAETVQLNYQITLLGLRDLEVVPDQHLGFEMTLLRLLAFAPAPVADGSPPVIGETASGPVPAAASAPLDAQSASTPAVEPAGTTEPSSAPNPEGEAAGSAPTAPSVTTEAALCEQWYELLDDLPVTGVVRMLGEHSLPTQLDAERCVLALDVDHEMLLADGQVQRLEEALSAQLGQRCRLSVTLERLDRETPAARKLRERQERQQAAEAAVRRDAVVRQLIDTFGGELRQVTLLEELEDAPQPE